MTLGNKIKELRIKKGILQRELASKLHISEGYLSKIENDQKPLKRKDLRIISIYLSVDIIELETLWLARKVCYVLKDEKQALHALQAAEIEVKYKSKKK